LLREEKYIQSVGGNRIKERNHLQNLSVDESVINTNLQVVGWVSLKWIYLTEVGDKRIEREEPQLSKPVVMFSE
jgi:hypothetical protein